MRDGSSGGRRWQVWVWGALWLAAWPAAAKLRGSVDEPRGEAVYAIPIVTPPGTGGVGPELALEYRSGQGRGGSGWLGLGWTLRGLGAIERAADRGVPYDYATSCGGAPCYRNAFTLDGQDLVCADAPCAQRYKTRRDDGRRIEYEGAARGWVVQDRDGTRSHYGTEPQARLVNPSNGEVFAWLLARVEDVHGNWMEVSYDAPAGRGVAYPAAIAYAQAGARANRRVDLVSEPRSDRRIDYRGGLRREVDRRLASIEVRAAADELVTRYALEYAHGDDSGRSLLAAVRRVGADGVTALPPHRFEYSRGVRSFAREPRDYCDHARCHVVQYASASARFPDRGYVDLDRDGLLDVYENGLDPRSGPGLLHRGDGERIGGTAVWTDAFAPLANGITAEWPGGATVEMVEVLLDVTGDGYPDALSYTEGLRRGGPDGLGEPPLPLALPGHASADTLWTPLGYERVHGYRRELHATLVDMNGDGRRDAVFATSPDAAHAWPWLDDPDPPPWRVHLNRAGPAGAPVFGEALAWADPMRAAFAQGPDRSGARELEVATVDLNADGLPDRIRSEQAGPLQRLWVAYHNGSGFTPEQLAVEIDYAAWPEEPWHDPPPPVEPIHPRRAEHGCVYMDLVDLNGDGFPDLVQSELASEVLVWGDPAAPAWLVRFGTGSGFRAEAENWATRDAVETHENDYRCIRGVGPHAGLHGWASGLQDFDGDGLLDRHQHSDALVYLNPGPRSDLLVRATTPLGGSIAFEYGASAPLRNPAGGSASPGLAPTRAVVVRTTVSDGRPGTPDVVTDFHYARGEYDPGERDFRGFGKVTRTEPGGGGSETARVVSLFKTDRACAGRLGRRDVRSGSTLLARETRGYLRVEGPDLGGDRWTACLLELTLESALEGDPESARTRRTLRRYGPDPAATHYNVQSLEEWGEVGVDGTDVTGDERFTAYTYAAPLEAGSHLVSRLASVAVRDSAGGPTVAYQRIYYDGLPLHGLVTRGLATRLERRHDDPYADPPVAGRWIGSVRVYDGYGNPVAEVGPPTDDDPDGLRSERDYDATYASFVTATRVGADTGAPLTETRALGGCVGGEPPPGLGLPCASTDPAGRTERFGYDAFGRLVRAERPSGLVETWSRELPAAGAAAETRTLTRLDLGDGVVLTRQELRDGLGRVVVQEAPGKDREVVRVERSYDARGRLHTETLPHFRGAFAPLARTLSYDALGRPSGALEPDGETRIAWSYAPWRLIEEVYFGASTPASRQRRTERELDGLGRTVAVTRYADPSGLAGAVTTRARYTALDQVREIHDPMAGDPVLCLPAEPCATQQHREQHDYDSLGRRVRSSHPDAGVTRFRYDDAGRLTERIDAVGRSQRLAYDALGRLRSRRLEPEGSGAFDAALVYGDAPGDPVHGLLVAVVGEGAGTDYGFAYDSAGRVASVSQSTAGLELVHSFEYDALDRVVAHTFPDGERYERVFDGARLTAIVGGGVDVLMDADYDALGRTLRLAVGRTLTVDAGSPAATLERSYDVGSGRLERITARGRMARGAPDLELELELDGLGRLAGQHVSVAGRSLGARAFDYDGLGRLASATGPWERALGHVDPVTWTYGYDPLGNLRSRTSSSGAGGRRWRYEHPDKPSFLTHVVDPGGRGDWMTADASGRPDSITLERQTWNALGRWHRSASMSSSRYTYDAFGRRVLQVIPSATEIVYAGDDFEYDTTLELGTKSFFVNGARIASRTTSFRATPAGGLPAIAPTLAGIAAAALGLAGLLGVGSLGLRRRPAGLAASGVGALVAGLVLGPPGWAGAVIGWGGGPTWHGGHAEGLLVYAADQLGSVRAVIDATGALVETRDYAPFGATLSHAGELALKHRFTGQPHDDTSGRHHYGARLYDASWGRFLSPDEREPTIAAPDRNRYAYVHSRPTSLVDPDGRVPVAIWVAVVGAPLLGIGAAIAYEAGHPKLALTLAATATLLATVASFGQIAALGSAAGAVGSFSGAMAAGLTSGGMTLQTGLLASEVKGLHVSVVTGLSFQQLKGLSPGSVEHVEATEVDASGLISGTVHFDNGDVVEIRDGEVVAPEVGPPTRSAMDPAAESTREADTRAPRGPGPASPDALRVPGTGGHLDSPGSGLDSTATWPWALQFLGLGCCSL